MARNPEETPKGWDPVVDTYEKAFQPFTTQFVEEALRLADLKPGQDVLDVAAGIGALTLAAAKGGANVTAIDFSPNMVDRLRVRLRHQNLSNASVYVMDAQALDFPNERFDAVFSTFGVFFFPDRHKGFTEIRFHRNAPGSQAPGVRWCDCLGIAFSADAISQGGHGRSGTRDSSAPAHGRGR